MANTENSETLKELNDAIRGNAVSNIAPTKVADTIVPVINVNPKDYRRATIRKSVTSAGAVYTTPATGKDFYLTYFYLSASSVTAGNNNVTLSITPFGDTTAGLIAAIVLNPTAATDCANDVVCCELSHPIKLARNSAITYATNGTIAQGRCIIMGYEVDE